MSALRSVGEELDVGVGVDVHAAAGGDVAPAAAVLGQPHGEHGFAVGAHQFAEPIADAGQRAAVFAVGQQFVGAQRAAGEHHAAGGVGLAVAAAPAAGVFGA